MNYKVLIVDRDYAFGKSIADLMIEYGIETDYAPTSEEAMICFSRKNYDAALIYLHMPNIDGIKLARAAKGTYPGLEAIIVSERGTIDDYIKAHSLGVSEFIYKSLALGAIASIVKESIKMKKKKTREPLEGDRRFSLRIRGVRKDFNRDRGGRLLH